MYPLNKVLQNGGDEERKLHAEFPPLKFYTSCQISLIALIIERLLKIKIYIDGSYECFNRRQMSEQLG